MHGNGKPAFQDLGVQLQSGLDLEEIIKQYHVIDNPGLIREFSPTVKKNIMTRNQKNS